MSDQAVYTAEALREVKFRGPVRFADGVAGLAEQDFECETLSRFGYRWRRENYDDKGRIFYVVDGEEVADLDAAAAALSRPADPNNPQEQMRRIMSDPEARREWMARNEAENFAAVQPFGSLSQAMDRADHSWHVGINRFQDAERKEGRQWQSWLYDAKHAAHEAPRLMLLWRRDRERDTGLRCILDQACRECPMLKTIEAAMIAGRERPEGSRLPPREISDADIDMAKTWTCIAHVLASPLPYKGEGFLRTHDDRRHAEAEARMLQRLSEEMGCD